MTRRNRQPRAKRPRSTRGSIASEDRIEKKRDFGRFDGFGFVMDLRMGRIVVGLGDGVRIGRRLRQAAASAGARPESDKRDENEGARVRLRADFGGIDLGARIHEAAPVGWRVIYPNAAPRRGGAAPGPIAADRSRPAKAAGAAR